MLDEPSKVSSSCGVSGVGVGFVTRQVSSRGFFIVGSPVLMVRRSYLDTLSARDVAPISMSHGFAYCKSPMGQRVGFPAGQYSFLVLRQSSPGTACPFLHQLVSAGPHALAVTCPLGHSLVFPHPDEKHVCFVDTFIDRTSQTNAQTKSLTLTPRGHTFSG